MFTGKNYLIRYLGLFLLLLNIKTAYNQSTVHLLPKKGLHVTTNGVAWLTGSEISFFTPDKQHHHYYFTWWEQDIDTLSPCSERLLIGSKNTAVNGSYELENMGDSLTTKIECSWNLPQPGVADVIYAKLWLPFFSEAVFSSPSQSSITDWSTFHGTSLKIKTNFGVFTINSGHPFQLRADANQQPGEKDYTQRAQYLLLYEKDVPVSQKSPFTRSFSIKLVSSGTENRPTTFVKNPILQQIPDAWQPDNQSTLLLPQPKSVTNLNGKYLIPEKKKGTIAPVISSFRKLLMLQWQLGENYFPAITSREDKKLPAEGYTISINENGVIIYHHTAAGLQHALHTLVQLVKNENGKLVLPFLKITDWPSTRWRGIHMFTGPTSWSLHRQMYDRVLFPLKMNKVVLQCEQAAWQSRPELHNSISVPMKDLKAEFDYLRKNNNEPIPLIQSLGHMEWFFKPKQNRKLAVNPEYPYTINPDLKEGRAAVRQLWDETFSLLKPKTMHIGFDEIGMIGFHLPKEKEVDYFKTQINFLHKYATGRNAKLMIWGDMGLGPGEGPDALNGVTKERAATIRSFIPSGTYVADWHYINNPDPEVYKTNLRIWKQNKNIPLASPWLWPNNVFGFVKAAIDEKAGVLQTTWADFESSEKNMLLNIEQFGAYILAMDYAWSGRKELPDQLTYHPVEEWVKRFYTQPKPVKANGGYRLTNGFQLSDVTKTATSMLPDSVVLHTEALLSGGFILTAVSSTIVPEGTPVTEVSFVYGNKIIYSKQLRYGVEVRAESDKRKLYAGSTKNKDQMIDFFTIPVRFDKVIIVNRHPASGLKVKELILLKK